MTRRERRAIIHAMKYIHSDESDGGAYEVGMDILAKLVGLPTFESMVSDMKTISIFELAARVESGAVAKQRWAKDFRSVPKDDKPTSHPTTPEATK